eukprot:765107-Hanusia_phi.AAC.1
MSQLKVREEEEQWEHSERQSQSCGTSSNRKRRKRDESRKRKRSSRGRGGWPDVAWQEELRDIRVGIESDNSARRVNVLFQERTARLEQAVEEERRGQEGLARREELIAKSCSRLLELAKDVVKLSGVDKDLNVLVSSIQLQKVLKSLEGSGEKKKEEEEGKEERGNLVAVWTRLCGVIGTILLSLH